MSDTPRTDDNAAYWRMFITWLEAADRRDRVQLIQQCIQEKGPAPDDQRPRLERLLKP